MRSGCENLNNPTFGNPEPMQVRVFSLLNAPQILALYLAMGVLLAIRSRSLLRFVAVPAGLIAITLSMARTGWVGLIFGLVYLALPDDHARQRVHLLLLAVGSVVVFAAVLQDPKVSYGVQQRFNTLSDVRHDDSIVARLEGHEVLFASMLRLPLRPGPRRPADRRRRPSPADAMLSRGGKFMLQNDSTLAVFLVSLGLLGAALALASLAMHHPTDPASSRHERSPEVVALKAMLVVLLAEFLLDNIINGPAAFLTWACLGFSLALASQPMPRRQPPCTTASLSMPHTSSGAGSPHERDHPHRAASRRSRGSDSLHALARGASPAPGRRRHATIATRGHAANAACAPSPTPSSTRSAILLLNAGTGVLTARTLMPRGRGELAAMILWPLFLTFITTLGIPSSLIYVMRQRPSADRESIATGLGMTLLLGHPRRCSSACLSLPLWLGRQYSPEVIHAAQWFLAFTPILALTQSGRAVLEARKASSRSPISCRSSRPQPPSIFLLGFLAGHQP